MMYKRTCVLTLQAFFFYIIIRLRFKWQKMIWDRITKHKHNIIIKLIMYHKSFSVDIILRYWTSTIVSHFILVHLAWNIWTCWRSRGKWAGRVCRFRSTWWKSSTAGTASHSIPLPWQWKRTILRFGQNFNCFWMDMYAGLCNINWWFSILHVNNHDNY